MTDSYEKKRRIRIINFRANPTFGNTPKFGRWIVGMSLDLGKREHSTEKF